MIVLNVNLWKYKKLSTIISVSAGFVMTQAIDIIFQDLNYDIWSYLIYGLHGYGQV